MKSVGKCYILGLFVLFSAVAVSAQDAAVNKITVSEFEVRVREYSKQREAIERTLPKLSKQATAEQITAHKSRFLKAVLAARKGTPRGSIFTPAAERLIRSIIASEYKGRAGIELRRELSNAENKAVPVKINAVYPESNELLEMPPTLLLVLPQLTKHVRYRFVGSSLLLVDRENHLIVDYMPNALP